MHYFSLMRLVDWLIDTPRNQRITISLYILT